MSGSTPTQDPYAMLPRPTPATVRWAVVRALAESGVLTSLTADDLLCVRRGPGSRHAEVLKAKAIARCVMRRRCGMSYQEIARATGATSHESTIKAIKHMDRLMPLIVEAERIAYGMLKDAGVTA